MFDREKPKHPYADAWQCEKFEASRACLCPAWLEVIQESTRDGSESSSVVKGCFFQLFPWLISGAIRSNNRATEEASGVRQDVQLLHRDTVDGLGAVAGLVRGAAALMLPGLQAKRTGELARAETPAPPAD